jgi:DNA-binding NarL/FixJ family response regulator
MTNVAILDGRPGFRTAVAEALALEGFTVEAPADVVTWSAAPGRAVIVDVSDDEGAAVLDRLRTAGSTAIVVALVAEDSAPAYAEALRLGANNAAAKAAHPDIIIGALHAALTGHVVLPTAVAGELTRAAQHGARPQLTQSQLRLLRLIAAGHSMQRIAQECNVSERTVYRDAKRLIAALGASSRSDALVRAGQLGLLRPEER